MPLALRVIDTLRRELGEDTPVLQARLYQHGSFAFQFVTDSVAFIEQYTYIDKQHCGHMPLPQYTRPSPIYHRLSRSAEITWNGARPAQTGVTLAGAGPGLRESRMIGIFRQDDRMRLASREREALDRARPGSLVDIQALSARFYIREAKLDSLTERKGGGPKVRLLIANPTSRNAILRAVADKAAVENIRGVLDEWTWDRHRTSDLYTDVHHAIRRIHFLKSSGHDIELRLSAADLSCSLLLAPDRLFVEQYSYGRSQNYHGGVTLGGEYDVFEYERGIGRRTREERILESGFEVIWDSYSISAEEYVKRPQGTEEAVFEKELEAIRAQLGDDPPRKNITLVILAAGYGMRMAADLEKLPALKGKPKALLPVRERPMIEWLLESVEEIGEIGRKVIVTNEKFFREFTAWQRKNPKWKDVKIISDGTCTNEMRRGAIGALRFAVDREEVRGSVLVMGADNFFEGSFRAAVDNFLRNGTGVVVVHDEGSVERVAGRFGVVRVDGTRIVDFEEKPEQPSSTLASTLCYLLTAGDIRLLKAFTRADQQWDNIGDFIRYLVVDRSQPLEAFRFDGIWRDIGTLAEYLALNEDLNKATAAAARGRGAGGRE